MATYYGTYSGRSNHRLRLDVATGEQSVAGNWTYVSWALYLERTSGTGSYYLTAGGSSQVIIEGQVTNLGGYSYDTRSTTTILLASGAHYVGHAADGTLYLDVSASTSAPGTIGSASLSGGFGVATIARASTSTLSAGSVDAGSAVTINTNRASASFTHTVDYYFGSTSGNIATNVGASTEWTVPLDLLAQIPSAVSGVGFIRTTTFSGGVNIGYKDTSVTITAGAGVVPTFTTVTHSEATAGVATAIGGYVQGVTKLNLAITGAAGVQGSTISSYKIEVGGQSIAAASGTTAAAITQSGAVPIVATITDSRGRTATKTVNATVLAYAPPAIDTSAFSVRRATAAGAFAEEGTYIRVDLKAAVQSLIVGTQKNTLTYGVFIRARGATSWGTAVLAATPAGIAFDSYALKGTYSIESSWEVLVQVVDKFSTTSLSATVATASIFMHWGAGGLGLGKFHENGALDVAGPIFQNSGEAVVGVDPAGITPGSVPVYDLTSGKWVPTVLTVADPVPAGFIAEWPAAAAPANWLLCQGQAVSRTAYASLFAVIGTTYGAGDGSTTFNLPDFRGRVPVGFDSTQAEFDALGEGGGAKTHTLSTAEIPSHNHSLTVALSNSGNLHGSQYPSGYNAANVGTATAYPTGSAGGGGAHNNLQPYRTVNFIIKASNGDTPGDSQLTGRVSALEGFVGGQLVRNDAAAATIGGGAWTMLTATGNWTYSVAPSGVAGFDGSWTAPVRGLYNVDAEMRIAATSNMIVAVKKNNNVADGSAVVLSQSIIGTSGWTSGSVSGRILLEAGDKLRLAVFTSGYAGSAGWAADRDASRFGFDLVKAL